ncbi:MAG: hypothetical protein LBB27_04220 [Tannerellaceae bacterium]|nr:hypothetical protein [Tannerellaceae bacterium]
MCTAKAYLPIWTRVGRKYQGEMCTVKVDMLMWTRESGKYQGGGNVYGESEYADVDKGRREVSRGNVYLCNGLAGRGEGVN